MKNGIVNLISSLLQFISKTVVLNLKLYLSVFNEIIPSHNRVIHLFIPLDFEVILIFLNFFFAILQYLLT